MLRDITVQAYLELKDNFEYFSVLKHLSPINNYQNKQVDINDLSYSDVKNLFKLANNPKKEIDLFKTAFGLSDYEFYNEKVTVYFACRNYLLQFLKKIQENELKLLQSIDINDSLWEESGGNELNKFSYLTPLVQLGEIYSIYPFDLENKKYNEILVLLTLHKTKSKVLNKYQTLKNK